jgi:maleylacetoacetate isomerase
MIRVYEYWRSSASYRLRIALNLKGAAYETVQVNIAPGVDEQFTDTYKRANPQMRVPSIEIDGQVVGQSMAILEWIDEVLPGPSILPTDPFKRLEARAFADTIACDIHPLNNLSVLKELRETFGADDEGVRAWYHDWIRRGFDALELQVAKQDRREFLFDETPGLAEITLVPQVYNAERYGMDLSVYPVLMSVADKCLDLPAFQNAKPVNPTA